MVSIEKSIKLKKELDSLRPLKKDDELRIMQKFRLDWNYHSNNIEGNSLTYGEIKALILFGVTAQGKPLKDHFEVTGHDDAVKWIIEVVKQDRPLTENFIRELHKLILKESYEVNAITPDGRPTKKRVNVGAYKTMPNNVKTVTGEVFRFATLEETPATMHDLIEWYRKRIQSKGINPILLASEFHYKYIRIHPFDDGNGRTARILMNFILMQFDYPPAIIKTDDKEHYFAALRQADAGILEPFIDYISGNLNHSLELMIKGAKGESIEEPDDLDKEIALLEQRLEAVSQSSEVFKNQDSILEIYDDSISNVIRQFVEKAKRFEKFYAKHEFYAEVNNKDVIQIKDDVIETSRTHINDETELITFEFRYKAFKQLGFGEFGHASIITFVFNHTSYKARNTANVSFEMLYGEQLDQNQINQLLNTETKKHKAMIENEIEQFKKSR